MREQSLRHGFLGDLGEVERLLRVAKDLDRSFEEGHVFSVEARRGPASGQLSENLQLERKCC
ncbi:MAG: hypothetical protein R3A51_23145 [Nannocystaceae bacterium]